jgi:DNA modification methylase
VKPTLRKYLNQVFEADCVAFLKDLPNESIDLVVTSPPYADNRKKTYDGVPVNEYVSWFLPIADELHRVLKSDGSFVLNIKERTVRGERGTYVLELILAMREQGWLWTEEYMWHKKNCYPGKWPNRFRDAWERCLHFTKSKSFKMFQEAVMVPRGDWAEKRLRNLSETDLTRDESKVQSGFGKNVSNWLSRTHAYPTNVLHMATECANRGHSASFPEALPEWFIRLFTRPGDVVLDPFLGSGTTATACLNLDRRFIGIELNPEFVELSRAAIAQRVTLLQNGKRRRQRNGHKPTRRTHSAVPEGLL